MNSENVYEFDLQSFFPSVSISGIEEIMTSKLGIPKGVAHRLMEMHRSITKIPAEQKLTEDSDLKVLLTPSGKVNPNLKSPLKDEVEGILKKKGIDQTKALKGILPEG